MRTSISIIENTNDQLTCEVHDKIWVQISVQMEWNGSILIPNTPVTTSFRQVISQPVTLTLIVLLRILSSENTIIH